MKKKICKFPDLKTSNFCFTFVFFSYVSFSLTGPCFDAWVNRIEQTALKKYFHLHKNSQTPQGRQQSFEGGVRENQGGESQGERGERSIEGGEQETAGGER